MILLCVPYVTSYLYWDWHYFLVPFTNWTLIITTLTILMTSYAAHQKHHFNNKNNKTLLAIHHLLYTFSLICNFVVMSIYWSILHREQVRIHYNDPGVGHGRVIHLCLVHSLPGICCLINSYITNCRLKQGFWKLVLIVCIVYGAFVFVFWKITGRVQYPFIDFEKS